MKIGNYFTHEAADLFPMMGEKELADLAEDIKKRGQLQPIVMFAGKVLDGRNRLAACVKLGVSPNTEDWSKLTAHLDVTPLQWVISVNLKRRHLNPSQLATLANDAIHLFEAEAKKRQAAGLKKGPAAPVSALMREREPEAMKASEAAAEAFGVSARYIEQAKQLQKKSPELAQKVRTGDMRLTKAVAVVNKKELIQKAKVLLPPEGKFACIVWDPAWPYPDQLDGGEDVRGGLPYQEQTIQDLCDYPLPAADHCVLFLWITNHHVLEGSHVPVLKAQGFKGKYFATWIKKGAPGLGHVLRNNTEHLIIAVKGNPPLPATMIPTYFEGKKRQHSRKPEEFWKIAEELCPYPGPSRIELNARQKREGWVTHGIEADKFEPAPSKVNAHSRELRPMKELERECKVRGFTFILDEQEAPPEVIATCTQCEKIFNFALVGDNRAPVPVELLEEIREHTCDAATQDQGITSCLGRGCLTPIPLNGPSRYCPACDEKRAAKAKKSKPAKKPPTKKKRARP